jgi:hypothetical protein
MEMTRAGEPVHVDLKKLGRRPGRQLAAPVAAASAPVGVGLLLDEGEKVAGGVLDLGLDDPAVVGRGHDDRAAEPGGVPTVAVRSETPMPRVTAGGVSDSTSEPRRPPGVSTRA